MAKHKRWSNKNNEDSVQKDNITESKEQLSQEKVDSKSYLLSGFKYAYMIIACALLAGIFTPITLGIELELVISGILTIFLGLAGAVVILRGIKKPKFTTITTCGGLAMIFASLMIMYELAEISLFT